MSINFDDLINGKGTKASNINETVKDDFFDFELDSSKFEKKKTTTKKSRPNYAEYENKIETAKTKVSGWAISTVSEKLTVDTAINKQGYITKGFVEAIANIENDSFLNGNYEWLRHKSVAGIIPVDVNVDGSYAVIKAAVNKNEKPVSKLKAEIKEEYYKDIYIGIMAILRNYINSLSGNEHYMPLLSITPETVFVEIVESNDGDVDVHVRILPLWPVNKEYSHYIPREQTYTVLSDLYSAAYLFVELAGEKRAATIPNEIKSCLYPITYMRSNLDVLSKVIKEEYQYELGRIKHGSGSSIFDEEIEKETEEQTENVNYNAFEYENDQEEKAKTKTFDTFGKRAKDVLKHTAKFGRHATKQAKNVVEKIKSQTEENKDHDFDIMHAGTIGESKGDN